jgi:DNA-binding NarL/FixJ family response regulator
MKGNEITKHSTGSLIKTIENGLGITNKLLVPNLKPLTIVHLDDHLLFAGGVGNCILKKYPNAKIKNIQNGTEALAYILHCLHKNEKIDLIITDVSHPGLDGISFSTMLREKEPVSKDRIPLLFLTMHSDESVVKRIEAIPFVKYLSKAAGCLKITTAIENLI